MKPKQNQPNAAADTSARGRRLSRESGSRTRKSSATSRGSSTATRGSSRSELKGLQDGLTPFFTPGTGRQSRTSTGITVPRTTSASPAAKESSKTVKRTASKHTAPLPLHNLKVVIKPFDPAKPTEPLGNVASTVVPHDPSTIQNQPGPSNSVAVTQEKKPTVAKPLTKPVSKAPTLIPHGPCASQNPPVAFSSAAVTKAHQPTATLAKPVPKAHKLPNTEPLSRDALVPHNPSASQNPTVPSNSAAQSKGQESTVAKPLADFSEVVSAPPRNTESAEPSSSLAHSAPKPLANMPFSPANATEPRDIIYTSTAVPHAPSASQNQPVPSDGTTVSKGLQPKHSEASVQQHDAEVQRPSGSGTQAQPPSKKRPNVNVVSVEHVSAPTMPGPIVNKATGNARKRVQPPYDATDQLAQDIRNAGSKASKMGESEDDWQIRLFHAAREAHNPDADLRIRCEKFVEFIVDESFIGREPRDRRELFESLLEQCIQGVTLEDIACDDPPNIRVLKAYSKRVPAWKIIRQRFPQLLKEFKTQPEVSSPFEVLTADAFKKVNKYLGALKETMPSLPEMLKQAVVWQLLGSAGHPYERCTEDIRDRVAEKISENVP